MAVKDVVPFAVVPGRGSEMDVEVVVGAGLVLVGVGVHHHRPTAPEGECAHHDQENPYPEFGPGRDLLGPDGLAKELAQGSQHYHAETVSKPPEGSQAQAVSPVIGDDGCQGRQVIRSGEDVDGPGHQTQPGRSHQQILGSCSPI